MDISDFLSRVTRWAMQNEDVKALILVGSYAREEARVGEATGRGNEKSSE